MNTPAKAAILAASLYFAVLTPATHVLAAPPADFQTIQIVGSGLSGPTGFEFAPDGRVFILERTGAVKIYKNGALLPDPFVTLPSVDTGDRGLMGIAFDPDYAANHYVYLYYTATADLLNHLVRFDASADVAQGPAVEIFRTTTQSNLLHVGGTIRFGADGKLYLSVGDNGDTSNPQNLANSHGKVLRMNKEDGSAPAESRVGAPDDQTPGAFTPDGRTRVIWELPSGGKRRISLVMLDSARAPRPVVSGGFDNHAPSLSPDGRWVAYVSDESNRNEVYVRPFLGPGGRWQVSKEGGTEPRWSPTGREIFFRAGESMMAAAVQAGATFAPGEVRLLFRTTAVVSLHTNYDVTRDGQSFIMVQRKTSTDQTVVVLLNWFDQLRATRK